MNNLFGGVYFVLVWIIIYVIVIFFNDDDFIKDINYVSGN